MSLLNFSTSSSGRFTSNRSALGVSVLIKSVLFALVAAVFASTVFAQLAPSGEHYAGRPSDTGYGGTFVNATGALAASVPLDLPPARGGLPIPLQVTYGANGVGAAGLGWDLPLSYIRQGGTFAYRRPSSNAGDLPSPRSRMTMSLLGQGVELVQDGSTWVARYGTLEIAVRQDGDSWLAYDGKGRTYTFVRAAEIGSAGFWLLKSVTGVDGANIQLTYQILTWPLNGGVGYEVDLIRIDYNTIQTIVVGHDCSKNEITLTYGNVAAAPISISMLNNFVLVRNSTLSLIDVKSRAGCGAGGPLSPLQRLRRYQFTYAPDTDTLLPRLTAVSMFGREGTPEETTSLPIANYTYGSATSNGALHYQTTQTITLPTGLNYNQISGTDYDSSVNAPVPGDRYAMWQTLTDVTGDGRPDMVFKKNNQLWVAYNRPGPNGTTTIGAGLQGIAQLSDQTFSNGAVATQTSTLRRFQYGPANRNTTDVWREAIDINGDGRMDIIDAAEQPDHWVVYLNTPGPNGVQWQRRSFAVTNLRAALTSSGHTIDGPYVPLSRRATGTDLQIWQCWRWNGTEWQWYSEGFSNHRCQGVDQQVLARGSERTFVEWDLVDLNGDGYPDFVFDSSPVDFQLNPPPTQPTPVTGATFDGKAWHQFSPSYTNEVRVSFNVVGVRFDTDHDPFSRSVDTFAPAANQGVAQWRCPSYSLGGSCDDSFQTEIVGLADTNGDGLVDRVVGTNAYLGAYIGTAVTFSPVYIMLPGPLATNHNNHAQQCGFGGNQKPTAVQTQGLRDLTGDGIPDYYDNGQVWIGTGTGYRSAIPITSTGANFQFSHVTETCDGKDSNTDGGLFDIDGDGRPEVVGLGGSSLFISELVGTQAPGAPESGRLTEVDNGYGAATQISYVSAKQFTDNPVPFPEIVVSSTKTTGTLNFGGTLGATLYAYGNAELVFDSALDRFSFPDYERFVKLQLFTPDIPSAGKVAGLATITDTWPLAPFVPGMSTQDRWLRMQRVGRTRDILTVRDIAVPDPWALLSVDSSDPRINGTDNYEWDAKMYEIPASPTENVVDCLEMVAPLDFAYSFANNIGVGLDACRTHGFAFSTSENSWYGGAAPPSDNNVQTLTRTLTTDDFGRPVDIEYDNDVFRSDDDICVQNVFAVPSGTFPRILSALASRQSFICGKNTPLTIASESWSYDNLPPGAVSTGLVTSHNVDRRATDTGAVLNTIHVFDATYDANGNPATVSTSRNGATRNFAFNYDPFGLVPTDVRLAATGVPTVDVVTSYDPISLKPLLSGIVGQTQRGMDFDGFERPVRSTVTPPGGSLGVLSTMGYVGFATPDPAGRHIVSTRFDEPVPPANVTTTNGRTATMFLDELGRERRTELGLGSDYSNSILVMGSRIYDDAGRVAFQADPFPNSQDPTTAYGTTYLFKGDGDLDCIIRGRGPQLYSPASDLGTELFPTCFQRTFTAHTQVLGVRDAASLETGSPQFGVVRQVTATAIGREIERSTVLGGIRLEDARFGYDHLGQPTSMIRYLDPIGETEPVEWSLERDSLGQTLYLAEPNAATHYFAYSDWGEPVETHWNDGGIARSLVRSYDALGRLTTSEERNDGVADPKTVNKYEYDVGINVSPLVAPTFVLGKLTRATSPSGQETFSYDAFGRANAQVFADNHGQLFIEKAVKDLDGRLTSLEFNLPDQNYSNEVVSYTYDSAGRLRAMEYTDSAGSLDIYQAEDLDLFGRVQKATMGGQTVFEAAYAEDGRLLMKGMRVSSSHGSRRTTFGQFDPVGRELSRSEFRDLDLTARTTNTTYDNLGRLSQVIQGIGPLELSNWQYSYDALGNLLTLNNGAASATLSYSAGDRDQVCRIGYGAGGLGGSSCNVTHNGAGEVILEPTRTGIRQLNYFDSGRIRGIVQGPARANFLYDAFGDVSELDLTGVDASETRHDQHYGTLIERRDQVVNGATTSFISRNIPGPGGLFASRRGTGNDWVFQFGELRGNRIFTRLDGTFVQNVDYQPFGEARSTGVQTGNIEYTSYQWNAGDALAPFSLSQLGARVYDPVIGRFLSRDPLATFRMATTSNPYAFATNDPLNHSDPTGLDDCAGGIGQECLYLATLNPLSLLGAALDWLSNSGGSAPAPQPAPTLYTGPRTARGIELQTRALMEIGYVPKGFNLDTFSAGGMSMSDMIDRLSEIPSPERDAAIDAYNARLDRYADYSRVAGMTLFAIGTGGIAVSEGIGVVLLSRGMVAEAEFFGTSLTAGGIGGGGAAVAGNEVENELQELDELTVIEGNAATQGTAEPPAQYYIENGVRRSVASQQAGLSEIPATIYRDGQAPVSTTVNLNQLFSPKPEIPLDQRFLNIQPPIMVPIQLQPLGLPGQLPSVPIGQVKLVPPGGGG